MTPWTTCAVCLVLSASARDNDLLAGDWPQFRGAYASGVADGANPPISWNTATGQNVQWKTPIPGLGHASPIVVGERVFVVTAISGDPNATLRVGLYGDIASVNDETRHAWRIYCLDKRSGKIIWEQAAAEGVPRVKRHTKSSHANSTPASDGKHVVAFFGSEGLFCYDLDGKLVWKKDLGVLDSGFYLVPAAQWAFGSSPIIYRDTVIVQCDVQKNAFVAAFDIRDGRELWRTPRSDVPTWSTPTIHAAGEKAELIVNGYKHVGGYDPQTGKELWKLSGGGDIPVPTPVVAHDLVFISSAHGPLAPIYAIRFGASGDITLRDGAESNEHVVWSKKRDGIYMQSPLVYGDRLYACRDNGVLSCYAARTGEMLYRQRLGEGRAGFTASPVAADGRLYFTSEEGDVYVVKAGPEFELLATSPLGEVCMATPAISNGTMIFRTKGHVIAIAHEAGATSARPR